MAQNNTSPPHSQKSGSFLEPLIRFCLEYKIVVALLVLLLAGWGLVVSPFDWDIPYLQRDPVPVDAIPDLGENQQIVFTEWKGRSPQDMEDQVTYPLTVSLLGIPGVKTVRSFSMFGFSSIYIIFEEDIDFYWSRARVLEKLNSLPADALPEGVQPTLGPDATALGQIFWYTLEGRDEAGNSTGGWDLHELRSIQDWQVRYALMSAEGVSEVASIGGFVQEYQIDVDPDAMRLRGVTLPEVVAAVRMSNLDVGARTIEINRVEYVIRGIGFVESLADIERAVITVRDNTPVQVRDVAHVTLGPALRRGVLDKEGAEVVGGVVVVRYGENPLTTIQSVREKIAEISPGLPRKFLPDGTASQVTIVPFYDRSGLIYETLGTLRTALTDEILVTIIVVLILVLHVRSSLLISGLLPLSVLMCFIAMKYFGVDANIVALSGIAIAIGTMVDMGIVICENVLNHLDVATPGENLKNVVLRASSEVGGAVLTAVSTTIVSFLPVFTMEGAEGKLFKPLAFTKTFALFASVIVAITVIPPLARVLFTWKISGRTWRRAAVVLLMAAGLVLALAYTWWLGTIVLLVGAYHLGRDLAPPVWRRILTWVANVLLAGAVAWLLARHWLPLGPERGVSGNFLFVLTLLGGILLLFLLFQWSYTFLLRWFLAHKVLFLCLPLLLILFGAMTWLGFGRLFGWLPDGVRRQPALVEMAHQFPGLGKEFMPDLDEGSFLLMPTTMPHASIGEIHDVLRKQDMAIRQITEVSGVVGKLGRVDSALDPAPISMIETIITYHPEYLLDEEGNRRLFRHDPGENDYFRDPAGNPLPAADGQPYLVRGVYARDDQGRLIPAEDGLPFRLWRPALDPALNDGRPAWPGIRDPDDIWDAILAAAEIPGTTSAPRLQPIAARIVMLQSGMRAPMGIKIKGPDLATIERVGLQMESYLKAVPSVEPDSVFADRIVGKPYLEIHIDREAIARHGIMLTQIQDIIEVAIGGRRVTTTVEGRERYPVRVRYLRELRDNLAAMRRILVPAAGGSQIPLEQLAEIHYVRGPQAIKSEDTFLVGYVLFDKKPGWADVAVVEQARDHLRRQIDIGKLTIPQGVSYAFAGSYENQVRSEQRLALVLPLSLLIIVIILYLQFRRMSTTLLVFSGIAVAWAGGFIMIWLYGQPWFLDFTAFGVGMRELFQVHPINLSVAIWVGFLALFGIATDDGVIISTYLEQSFAGEKPATIQEVRELTVRAGQRRIRPALMTVATTILALIPVLTSSGRGADIMVPMAIPTFGGMTIALITVFVVPVLYCGLRELRLHKAGLQERLTALTSRPKSAENMTPPARR
ncbi:MAG: efflux RND transporter permease subunit [Acidobacteria bacterium]|nr:efflux RND transporter permease subunit [Acidobacteriota bacterium]